MKHVWRFSRIFSIGAAIYVSEIDLASKYGRKGDKQMKSDCITSFVSAVYNYVKNQSSRRCNKYLPSELK